MEKPETLQPLLLKPAQVSELIGIAKSHAYALISSGEIPSVRIGKSIRVPRDKFEEWVKALPENTKSTARGIEMRDSVENSITLERAIGTMFGRMGAH